MRPRIPIGILGVTGLVGRRVLARLADHPWFEVTEAGASDASVGMSLDAILHRAREDRGEVDAGRTFGSDRSEMAPNVTQGGVRSLSEVRGLSGEWTAPILVSALPSSVARDVEPRLAAAGHLVVSNASAHRADPSIPLVLPDVNPDHVELLGTDGGILTNPNCSVATFVPPLARLHRAFGVEAVSVTTLQAVSGAGSGGPTVLDLADNVLPNIRGEEEKVSREPRKLLGRVVDGRVQPADFVVSATTTRVPVLHGHMVDVSVRLRGDPDPAEVRRALDDGHGEVFPEGPTLSQLRIRVHDDEMRPQTRLDRDLLGGMGVTVGRIRRCPVLGVRFLALAHNLERGAAGAAVANAELVRIRGRIPGVPA
ncbi:MAG TPA: aspartate-semialdehyde dehydrogenase [Longimicrobiales bacterium]|nr:aspartate-semialdehyde dehydrogenase [Longimicrobiales bacterium]